MCTAFLVSSSPIDQTAFPTSGSWRTLDCGLEILCHREAGSHIKQHSVTVCLRAPVRGAVARDVCGFGSIFPPMSNHHTRWVGSCGWLKGLLWALKHTVS